MSARRAKVSWTWYWYWNIPLKQYYSHVKFIGLGPKSEAGVEKNGKTESVDENAMDLPKLFEEIKQMKPVHKQDFDQKYPVGQTHEYLFDKDDTTAINRTTSAEKRELEGAFENFYNDLRHAAESHRQTRKYIKSWIKPGMKMFDIWCV